LPSKNTLHEVADFSHLPAETIKVFIQPKKKECLTDEEIQKLTEFEGGIRYGLKNDEPVFQMIP
jgi:hypothetical protein